MNYFKKSCLALLLLFAGSCNKEELPEITDKGENTFGMLVNDTIWLPHEPSFFFASREPAVYYFPESDVLEVSAINTDYDEKICFSIQGISGPDTYPISYKHYRAIPDSALSQYEPCEDSTRFEMGWNCFQSYTLIDSVQSFFKVTRYDTAKRIVSGTFEMTMQNDEGEVLNITEGRLDAEIVRN